MAEMTDAAIPPAPKVILDSISIWWITWACVWTSCLLAGIAYLISKRHEPTIRIRGLTLTIASICMLHVYWFLCQIGWVIGRFFPEMAEFWIMSLYFPAGLACFQAANMRLLYVARSQERYMSSNVSEVQCGKSTRATSRPKWLHQRLISKLRRMDSQQKLYFFICLGMICQICVTIFIFCVSRKFHPAWGISGTETPVDPMARRVAISRGWEWVPSIVWQVFWTWICAPCILWKTRNIRDTHGWRLQTVACCVAGLPAAPLWLTGIYAPAMAPVNAYWVPPQWICLSILVIEIFTILLPCYIVFRHRSLHADTLTTIQQWETKQHSTSISSSCTSTDVSTLIGIKHGGSNIKQSQLSVTEMQQFCSSPSSDSMTSRPIAMYSLESLEKCLHLNPDPLQRFAALRDFSGENIAFLTAVADFKRSASIVTSKPSPNYSWSRPHSANQTLFGAPLHGATGMARTSATTDDDDAQNRQLFNMALKIYATSISLALAVFPINLSSREYKALEVVFESAAQTIYGRRHSSDSSTSSVSTLYERWTGRTSEDKPAPVIEVADDIEMRSASTPVSALPVPLYSHPANNNIKVPVPTSNPAPPPPHYTILSYKGHIPSTFTTTTCISTFDAAEKSIKHLVLQSTWAKFVKQGVLEEVRRTENMERLGRRNAFEGDGVVGRGGRGWGWVGMGAGAGGQQGREQGSQQGGLGRWRVWGWGRL